MTRLLRPLAVAVALLCAPAAAPAQTLGDVVNGLGTLASLFGGGNLQMIANQLIQIRNQGSMIGTLDDQFAELEDQLEHMRDAALGDVGPLANAFSALSGADAQTLLNAGLGAWQNRLSGTSRNVAAALASLDGSSLSDFLVNELAAADAIGDAGLRGLFPNNTNLSAAMADDWTEARLS